KLIPHPRVLRRAEELDLHLLELARPEREVPRRHLVPERLADLRDAEGNLHARRVEHVLVVDEDALRRLGAQVRLVVLPGGGADVGLKHQVEIAGRSERPWLARGRRWYLSVKATKTFPPDWLDLA